MSNSKATAGVVAAVFAAAREAAVVFVDEAGRAYSDADDGNWDAEAWAQAATRLGLSNEEQDALWPGFARVLRQETARLVGAPKAVYTLRVKDAPGQPGRDLTADAETLQDARREAMDLAGKGFVGGSVALFDGVPDYADAPLALFRCTPRGVVELEA